MKFQCISLIGIILTLSCTSVPPQRSEFDHQMIDVIVGAYQDKEITDFASFKSDVMAMIPTSTLTQALQQDRLGKKLAEHEAIHIYRLLGTYTQLKYKKEMIALLTQMVALDTSDKKIAGYKPHEDPDIIAFGKLLGQVCRDFGLEYKNFDNRIFEVTLPGSGDEMFGLLTHADIVPADASTWDTDPFQLTIKDGKMYGRGTEDDKCSIAVALYAMKVIKENRFPIKRSIRLMVETTEETGGAAFEEHMKTQKSRIPNVNIVLDSSYPIVSAEKGFGWIYAEFPLTQMVKDPTLPRITKVTGGTAINQIPGACEVTVVIPQEDQTIRETLKSSAERYNKSMTNGFRIEISDQQDTSDTFVMKGIGRSAHSSEPEQGLNPIAFMSEYIMTSGITWEKNHWSEAVRYLYDNYGTDYLGKTFGLAWSDDFMGPLTMSPTYVKRNEQSLKVGVNFRAPRGKEPDALKEQIIQKLTNYRQRSGMNMTFDDILVGAYMYRNPKGKWITTLLDIFGSVTGKESKPISSSGGTTAKLLPNAVSFGPSMPGEKYMGHNDNEFKTIQNFLFDVQMFTEMFVRIGNLDSLE